MTFNFFFLFPLFFVLKIDVYVWVCVREWVCVCVCACPCAWSEEFLARHPEKKSCFCACRVIDCCYGDVLLVFACEVCFCLDFFCFCLFFRLYHTICLKFFHTIAVQATSGASRRAGDSSFKMLLPCRSADLGLVYRILAEQTRCGFNLSLFLISLLLICVVFFSFFRWLMMIRVFVALCF